MNSNELDAVVKYASFGKRALASLDSK